MKQILIITIALSGFWANAQTAPKKVKDGHEVGIKTSAICEMCKYAIEKDMAFEKGVKSSDLDLDTKVLTVVYNEKKTSPEAIRLRITEVGYHADSLKRNADAYAKLPECCKDGAHSDDPHKQ